MATHVAYLKSKYEDLDRRRQLEAEGFHTDIRMLRERLKELEKKIDKVILLDLYICQFSVTISENKLLIFSSKSLNLKAFCSALIFFSYCC